MINCKNLIYYTIFLQCICYSLTYIPIFRNQSEEIDINFYHLNYTVKCMDNLTCPHVYLSILNIDNNETLHVLWISGFVDNISCKYKPLYAEYRNKYAKYILYSGCYDKIHNYIVLQSCKWGKYLLI